MEELAEINFIVAMEGQEIKRTMAKMVSNAFPLILNVVLHIRMLKFCIYQKPRIQTLIIVSTFRKKSWMMIEDVQFPMKRNVCTPRNQTYSQLQTRSMKVT